MKKKSCCPPDTLCLFSDGDATSDVWSTTATTTYLLTVKPEAGLRSPGSMELNAATLKMKVVQQSAPLTIKVDDKAFTASPAIVPPSIVLLPEGSGTLISTVADALLASAAAKTGTIDVQNNLAVAKGKITAAPGTAASGTTGDGELTLKFSAIAGTDGAGSISSITVTNAGTGYQVGNTLTIDESALGTRTTDLVITLVADDFVGASSTSSFTAIPEGGKATINFKLLQRPFGNVGIILTSASTGRLRASKTSLTFTKDDYNTPQSIEFDAVPNLVQVSVTECVFSG